MSQTEEIKSRLDIVDIVSEHVSLKPAGTNHKGLCPFHSEKTPSFMVSRDRQIWHCFGCGEGGDVISFVQKIESMDFLEALKVLAVKAGVKLIQQDPAISSLKNTLENILSLTAKFWRKVLLESASAEPARQYLIQRGINEEVSEEFALGFAPKSWDTTLNFLLSKGFKENDIFLAGLLIKKERGTGFYDRFRGRIMFPIRDHQGTVVGFGGRIMPGDDDKNSAKYINSPQTQAYNKSSIVYNLDQAKGEIKRRDCAVVVEGYMDVIASWRAGVRNVVATSGTALTAQQIKLLSRFTKSVAFAFDADQAGHAAALRGLDLILETELAIKVITLPDHYKDPDECVQADPQLWQRAVERAQPFMEYLFDTALRDHSTTSVEGKKAIGQALMPFIAKLGNPIEQSHWVNRLATTLNTPAPLLFSAVAQSQVRRRENLSVASEAKRPQPAKKGRRESLEEILLALVLKYPQYLEEMVQKTQAEYFTSPRLQNLYKYIVIFYTRVVSTSPQESFQYEVFRDFLETVETDNVLSLQALSDSLVLLAEKDFFDYDTTRLNSEFIEVISALRTFYLKDKFHVIKLDLEKAERLNDREKIRTLSEDFTRIVSELNLLQPY